MACGGLKAIQVTRRNINGEQGEDDEQPLSPITRLLHEPNINLYTVFIFTFKTPINLIIFKQLMSPLLHHPRFSSLQVKDKSGTGKLGWVRTKVDINNHIIVPTLDTNVDSPDKFVEDFVSDLSKTCMDMSRPMWDWHVLNLKTSDGESTAILRLHHSLGDGISLMSLFFSLAQEDSKTRPVDKKPEYYINYNGLKCLFQGCLRRVWSILLMLWNTVVGGRVFLEILCLNVKDTKTPLKSCYTGWNSRRFVHKTINLDDVKLVKNTMKVTINDVMIAVTQAGLSRYLNRKYGEGGKDATERSNNLPKNIRLRTILIFNLRPSQGIPELTEMMKEKSKVKWGNKIGCVLLPLNIALKDDPLDYVRDAKASMDTKKASYEANCSFWLANVVHKLRRSSRVGNFAAKMTMAFSNVLGPQKEIILCGHPVSNMLPSIYGAVPLALVVHVGSYANKMNIVLSVDDRVISDPHQLCDDLGESFNLIKQSTMALRSS